MDIFKARKMSEINGNGFQNGSNGHENDPDKEKKEEVAGSSTKPKVPKTREIQTQTVSVSVVPTFVLGDVDADANRQTIQSSRSVDRDRPNDLPPFVTQERRPSLSRRRNFSLSLSPRLNQNFTYTTSEDIDVDPISNDNRPTQEQIYRRKTSMPSRPSDLPLLFSHNDNNKKRRVIDGRNIGDANEASFEQHTEEIVQSFMSFRYERDTRQWVVDGSSSVDLTSPGSVSETPIIPEFQQVSSPLSPTTTLLARKLVLIADDLESRYGPELDVMARSAVRDLIRASAENLVQNAFEIFRNIASKIFDQGRITWTRIVTLLSFGYRMGMTLFRQSVSGFVSLVVQLVTRYILLDPIRKWIVQSGGWFAALTSRFTNDDDFRSQFCYYYFWGVAAVAVTSIVCRHFFGGGQ